MATVPGTLISQLAQENFWYSDISQYLLLVQSGKPITLTNPRDGSSITLDANQGWEFLQSWATNHNFSLSSRRSRRSQINDLLADISNRQKLETEAATSLNALKLKAREGDIPASAKPSISSSLLKAEQIQRDQIAALEKKLFDPLTAYYLKSPLLAQISGPELRLRAATVLAANPQLVALYDSTKTTSGRPHLAAASNQMQLVLSRSIPELSPLFYTLRSDDVEAATASTLAGAHQELSRVYAGARPNTIDVGALQDDLHQFQTLAHVGNTLTDISTIIQSLPPTYLGQDIKDIDLKLHQIIAEAAVGTHVSGQEILHELATRHKLSSAAIDQLRFLAPRLELAEIALRTELSGTDLLDHTRHPERWSAGLAARAGLNPSTFWLKDEDLATATKAYLSKYGVANLDEAINQVLSQPTPDLDAYHTLSTLKDQSVQRTRYHDFRAHDTLFYLQDNLTQLNYRLQVIKEPYAKVARRVWGHIDKIDDVLHYPQRKLSDFLEDLVDGRAKLGKIPLKTVIEFRNRAGNLVRIPLLNLPGFFYQQFLVWQKSLAVKVFEWSYKLGRQGGLFTPLKSVANYAFGFIQHEGDFRATNFYFFRKQAGNFLDWGARKLGKASFAAWKTATKDAAFAIGNTLTKGLLSKAVAYLASLGLTVEGIGLFTTVALVVIDLTKLVFGTIKKFFTDADFRNKFFNIVPLIGGFFASAGVFLSGIPAALAFGLGAAVTALGTLLSSLAALFLPALLWALGLLAAVGLFYYVAIQTVPGLDSRVTQLAASIICDGSGSTTGDPTANAAICIAQVLSDCQLNPLFGSDLQTPAWQCAIAALAFPGAIDQLEASAGHVGDGWTSEPHLQCVGLAAAASGPGFPQQNACDYATNVPAGYTFSSTCTPGSLFVDANTCPGHIGVVISCDNATISCVDANFTGPGAVRGPTDCDFPSSQISGYLTKM